MDSTCSGWGNPGAATGICGAPGSWKLKEPGLNSGAATLRGLPNDGARECVAKDGIGIGGVDSPLNGCHEPEPPDSRGAPKTKGFANGLSDSLLPAEEFDWWKLPL